MSLRGLQLFGFRLNWRKRVGLVTFLVTIISFFWALAATNSNPSSSYFSTFSRIWELGIGALLALFAQSGAKVLPLLIRNVMSVSGFLMILTSAFVFTSSTPFPSLYTLFPTIGTALIIRAGMNSDHQGLSLIEKVSGFPPILFLGNISYSVYLWHLPIIVFSSEFYVNSNSQLFSKLLILALILLLSSLTYVFIEKPTQMKIKVPSSWYAKKFRPSDSLLKGVSFPKFHIDKIVLVSILLLVLSFTLVQLPIHKITNPEDGTSVPIESTQAAQISSAAATKSYSVLQSEWMEKVREGNELRTIPNITAPSLDNLSADWEKHQFTDYVSNLPDAKTVYIYGDSIAGRFPVFSKMVFKGWNQHIRSLPGCGVPRSFSGVQGVGFDGFDCNGEWNKVRTEIIEKNPDLIIVISGINQGGDLDKTIAFLAKNSKNLLYLSGRPAQVSLTDCLEDKSTYGEDCFGFQDDDFLKYKEFERSIV